MEQFKPIPTLGGIMGFGIYVIVTTGLVGGLTYALAESSNLIKAMLFIPFSLFALISLYVVLSFFKIKYVISDSALEISWGLTRKVIPWSSVKTIEKVIGMPKVWGVFGARWPGYHVGAFNITGLGVMTIIGTQLEDNLVVLRTEKGVFGITPVHGNCFMDVIQRKTNLIAQIINLDENKESLLQNVPSEDNVYLGLAGLNLICLLAFITYLAAFFPSAVQAAVAAGIPGPPRELVLLAVIAAAVFLINLGSASKLYQNAASAGYMMWGLGIFINLFFITISVFVLGFGI
jgi:hypothetical protein